MTENIYCSPLKYRLLLPDFNAISIIKSTDFFNNIQISNFTKIRPVGAELFDADGGTGDRQTDMMKLIVDFRNFANAPKN